jgi:predicted 3-demethylubiquinone-9 3-methyltransferase (glyoxalase superfamily)
MNNSSSMVIGLWFETEAAEAAKFYCSIFPNSELKSITYFPPSASKMIGLPDNSVMGAVFTINGIEYSAFNGNNRSKFAEAMSFIVNCADQSEIDYYWEKLGEGTDPEQGRCGWMKDKFGITWQIIPDGFDKMLSNPDPEISKRVFAAMMPMKKLEIAILQAAKEGN